MVCSVRSIVLVLAILTVDKVRYDSCQPCTEGQYRITGFKHCFSCLYGCKSCSSLQMCNSCLDGRYMSSGRCRSCFVRGCSNCTSQFFCNVCNDGYYLSYKKCNRCGNLCKTCDDLNKCTSCNQGYYLDVITCRECDSPTVCSTCNTGYYLQDNTCTQCLQPCNTCESATTCTACNTGYYLQGSVCKQCPGHCTSCNSATYCTACTTGYHLYNTLCFDSNGTCVDGCTNAYYDERCGNKCSLNCVNVTCERLTGTCLSTNDESSNENSLASDIPEKDSIGVTTLIAIGAVIGIITTIIIVGAVIVVKVICKRRSHRRADIHHGTVNLAPDVMLSSITNPNDEGVVYEQIDDGTDVQHSKDNVIDNVAMNEDDATDKTGATDYEQIDGETNLQETGGDVDYLTMV